MFVVKATPAPGSGTSCDVSSRTVGTAHTLEGAKWLGLKDFVDNWVQGEWTNYDDVDVFEFRKALHDKKVNVAWDVQARMSGYLLEIDVAEETPDQGPFNIEEDFVADISVHEVWTRVKEMYLLDVLTDLNEQHFGASTRDGKRSVDVWFGKHGFTYELRDSGGSNALQAGGGGSAGDVATLVIHYLRTGEYK